MLTVQRLVEKVESVREDGMDKRSAMEMVNEHLGNRLLYGRNTSLANISGPASLWWMTIDPSKFKSDLHLLLAKDGARSSKRVRDAPC